MRQPLLPLMLLGLIFAGCSTTPTLQVSGQVSYLQRIALPVDAVLEVVLESVPAVEGDAPLMLASQRIEPVGGVPAPFALLVSPSAIESDGRYRVTASLRAPGMHYRSLDDYCVLTRGCPDQVDVLVKPVAMTDALEIGLGEWRQLSAVRDAWPQSRGEWRSPEGDSRYAVWWQGGQPRLLEEDLAIADQGRSVRRYLFEHGRLRWMESDDQQLCGSAQCRADTESSLRRAAFTPTGVPEAGVWRGAGRERELDRTDMQALRDHAQAVYREVLRRGVNAP